jgi:hypothetical protein
MPNLGGILTAGAVATLVAGAVVASRMMTGGLPEPTAPAPVPAVHASADPWLVNPAPATGDFTTAALDSLTAGPEGMRAAAARVLEIRAAGFEAAALDSSLYNSLEPGFLLVYSGVFPGDDLGAAERHVAALRAAGLTRDGYARHVSCWRPCTLPGQAVAGLR